VKWMPSADIDAARAGLGRRRLGRFAPEAVMQTS
jgi:hypothetical protein